MATGKKLPWLRLYTEMPTDPKIRRLEVPHRWLYVVVLCLARQSPVPGSLMLTEQQPITEADLAEEAGLHWRTVRSGMARLADVGLVVVDLDRDTWQVPTFERRQPVSDSSTSRVAKHRARGGPR
jgi:hypothetical protein